MQNCVKVKMMFTGKYIDVFGFCPNCGDAVGIHEGSDFIAKNLAKYQIHALIVNERELRSLPSICCGSQKCLADINAKGITVEQVNFGISPPEISGEQAAALVAVQGV